VGGIKISKNSRIMINGIYGKYIFWMGKYLEIWRILDGRISRDLEDVRWVDNREFGNLDIREFGNRNI
jgi:hypothetical protein